MRVVSGVGIDIVSVARIRESLVRFGPRFQDRVFTNREVADCSARKGRGAVEGFAARWAAKEAVIKALRPSEWLDFRSIEIRRDKVGAPVVALSGDAAALASLQGVTEVAVSVSHEDAYAVAVAIALVSLSASG